MRPLSLLFCSALSVVPHAASANDAGTIPTAAGNVEAAPPAPYGVPLRGWTAPPLPFFYPQPLYPTWVYPAQAVNPYPSAPAAQPAAVVPSVPPSLPMQSAAGPMTDAARLALIKAEAAIDSARAGHTLWVPAEKAFEAARAAAREGDSAGVLKAAQTVAEFTQLSAAQVRYPSTELPQTEVPKAEVLQAAAVAPVAATLPHEPAPPSLSTAARQALEQAEADIAAARAGQSLWVPAEKALDAARAAAKEGDSAAVLKAAQAIAGLTKLAAAQRDYPSTEMLLPEAAEVAAVAAVAAAAPQAPQPPSLSAAARQALEQAEADIAAARAGQSLWVPAEKALDAARAAAKEGDSAAVLKAAQAIAGLTKLAAAQRDYPSTEMVPAEAVPTKADAGLVVLPLAPLPQLSKAAREALVKAEAEIATARAGHTLWVPAENAFTAAQEAAKAFDSDAVLHAVRAVAEFTRLGAAQVKYPSTEMQARKPTKKRSGRVIKPKAKAPVDTPVKQQDGAAKVVAPDAATVRPVAPQPAQPSVPSATPKRTLKPRNLCWQGDRLVVCPEASPE